MFGNEGRLLTEADWSDINLCAHYPKSKILAEKAAWEIYE
jgi:dihydroflavonol-4-reductase